METPPFDVIAGGRIAVLGVDKRRGFAAECRQAPTEVIVALDEFVATEPVEQRSEVVEIVPIHGGP